jgi:DNA-binding MarR family transcriptional regulator
MTKMTKDELEALLRSLERKGMIESFIDADGEVRLRRTAKGNAVVDGEADWPEDSRYGLMALSSLGLPSQRGYDRAMSGAKQWADFLAKPRPSKSGEVVPMTRRAS